MVLVNTCHTSLDVKTDYIQCMGIEQHISDNPDLNPISALLCRGLFRFKRLSEARVLAEFIAHGCPNPRLAVMGISELFVNAVEHGNLGISYEEKSQLQLRDDWLEEIDRRLDSPEHKDQYVEVEFTRTQTEIQLKVTDQGHGFDWSVIQTCPSDANSSNPLSSHGRGILMAKQLSFKSLEYSGKGNVVTATIAIK